jgi:lyso-ornithine lipid O-acyltransferase
MTVSDRLRAASKFFRLIGAAIPYCIVTNYKARRLPPEEQPYFRALRQMEGCGILCRIIGVRTRMSGDVAGRGKMLVCNHFGILDPLALASRMPVAFVAKSEIEKWPFVGWVTRAMGVIFVHRDRSARTTDFVEQVRERLASGTSVLVFPEGTTSSSDEVQPFKTGTFAAVAKRDHDVVPVYLRVTTVDDRPLDDEGRDKVVWAQSPRSFLEQFFLLLSMHESTFAIDLGNPIPVAGRNRKELATIAHQHVSALAKSGAQEG